MAPGSSPGRALKSIRLSRIKKKDFLMLPCQRALYDLEPGVIYLNGAAFAPIPLSVQAAGEEGVRIKVAPWRQAWPPNPALVEETRGLIAGLINAGADDIAIVGSASYGIATACANVKIARGSRVLVLDGEHASLALGLARLAEEHGAVLETIKRPADNDFTAAVLAAIERPGAPPVSFAGLSPSHWSNGLAVDLTRVALALRKQKAIFLIDATQATGVTALDVQALRPDYMVMPTYKWLQGPYGLAFLYVAPKHQNGRPLEEHGANRSAYDSASTVPVETLPMLAGARRFDRGERDIFITIPMANAGLKVVTGWGQPNISERLRMLTDRLAGHLAELGLSVPPRDLRVPHIVGLALPDGKRYGLVEAMAAEQIHVTLRVGLLRVSPGVYNDEADIDRFAERLGQWLRA